MPCRRISLKWLFSACILARVHNVIHLRSRERSPIWPIASSVLCLLKSGRVAKNRNTRTEWGKGGVGGWLCCAATGECSAQYGATVLCAETADVYSVQPGGAEICDPIVYSAVSDI